MARLRATARRLEAGMGNGLLRIDYAAGAVYVAGEEIHLTPIEYWLLRLMSKNAGKVLTNEFITREIWGSSWESNIGSLRVFMTTLRRKISKASESGNMIQTHVGIGYRMVKL